MIVRRKKTFQLTVDEGWYSEDDLKELGWSESYSGNYRSRFILACMHACLSIDPVLVTPHLTLYPRIEEEDQRSKGQMHCPRRNPLQATTIDYDSQFLWASHNIRSLALVMGSVKTSCIFIIILIIPFAAHGYDGEFEYWVVVKESGKRTEGSSFEREHAKLTKAGFFVIFYFEGFV